MNANMAASNAFEKYNSEFDLVLSICITDAEKFNKFKGFALSMGW